MRNDQTAQRLRALAKRTALDGIGEELLAIADGLDAAQQRSDADFLTLAESVGLIGPGSRVGDSHNAAVRFGRALTQALATAEPVQDVTPTSGNILVDAFNEVQALKQQATTEPDEDDDKWRDVALRFDKHRMQALWHLQAMLKDPEKHADIVRQFLKDPTHPAAATTERKLAATPDHNGAPVPASPADMQVYDKIAADYWTERKGEPPELVPREWRQALRKLAFMARTSGGTSGPDAGLQAALQEAEEILAKPYSHTSPQVPDDVQMDAERYRKIRQGSA